MIRLFGHYLSPALLALLGAEALTLFGSLYLSQAVWSAWVESGSAPAAILPNALVFTGIMTALLIAMGVYERNFWRGPGDLLLRIGVSFLFGVFVLTLASWRIPLELGRGEMSLAFGIAGASVALLHWGFLRATGHAGFKRRVLVLGVGQQAARLEDLLSSDASSVRILGYVQVHDDETPYVSLDRRLPVTRRLVDQAAAWHVDEIVVALDDQRQGFPLDELLACKLAGIAIRPVLAFVERETGRISLESLRPSSFLFADGFPALFNRQPVKRAFDFAASLGLLALTGPILLLAALAIGWESGFREPILYRQIRVGQQERPFTILKFRTMRVDAGSEFARPGDPRITRVGRLLRETRIDELPQLVNVLRGEMSLVGPRPEQPHYVARLRAAIPFYGLRHLGPPGLTGWAQICYPYADSEQSSREKLQYDLYYLKNASFGFDLLILLQTVHTILWGSGAR